MRSQCAGARLSTHILPMRFCSVISELPATTEPAVEGLVPPWIHWATIEGKPGTSGTPNSGFQPSPTAVAGSLKQTEATGNNPRDQSNAAAGHGSETSEPSGEVAP